MPADMIHGLLVFVTQVTDCDTNCDTHMQTLKESNGGVYISVYIAVLQTKLWADSYNKDIFEASMS